METADDIIEELRRPGPRKPSQQSFSWKDEKADQEANIFLSNLPPEERLVYDVMASDPIHVDEIVRLSGLAAGAVAAHLLSLELKSLVEQVSEIPIQGKDSMPKSLVIVESPTKAATIKKYLGPEFEVKASVGHIMDLPGSKLGVDVGGDFTPQYQVIPGKEKVISELKKAAKNAKAVYLAPDPDREGEAIAWHIADTLGKKEGMYRVLFHELTQRGISQAMESPGILDRNKYESQVARRVLDRLVGYHLSPLLWKKLRYGLSAGRVQSVALRLIVDRNGKFRPSFPKNTGPSPPTSMARLRRRWKPAWCVTKTIPED